MALTKVSRGLLNTSIVDNGNDTAITIDSSQNVTVGKTSLAIANEGIVFEKGGAAEFTTDAARVMRLNRTSDDGSVLEINQDGTTVGKFQSRSGLVSTIILDPRTNGAGLTGSTNGLVPVDQTGSGTNNVELGSTSSRFNTLYLGNDIAHLDTAGNARLLYDRSSNLLGNAGTNLYGAGIYLGGTAATNYLDDYEEGTWNPTAGVSLAVNYANYIKIGGLVYINVDLLVSSGSTSGSSFQISLPFNSITTYQAGAFSYQTTGFPDATVNITTVIGFRTTQSGSNMTFAQAQGKRLIFSATYKTTA
jgi:hypothetical protein